MTQPITRDEMLEKARRRAFSEGVQVFKVQDGMYVSPAKSEPGRAYLITVIDNDPACNCLGAANRGICKHQAAVMMLLGIHPQPANHDADAAHLQKAADLERDLEEMFG